MPRKANPLPTGPDRELAILAVLHTAGGSLQRNSLRVAIRNTLRKEPFEQALAALVRRRLITERVQSQTVPIHGRSVRVESTVDRLTAKGSAAAGQPASNERARTTWP